LGYNELCLLQQNEGSLWKVYFDDYLKAPYMVKGNQWVGYDNLESITYKAQYANTKGLAGGMVWSIDTDDFRGRCNLKYAILERIKQTLDSGSTIVIPPKPERPDPTNPTETTKPPLGSPPPTEGPTEPPTEGPTEPPTEGPTEPPTEGPTEPPTEGPTEPPTEVTTEPEQRPETTPNPPPGEFSCTEPGTFRHRDTCLRYYQCVQSLTSKNQFTKYDRDCPPGTIFDGKTNICTFPQHVDDCVDGKPISK